MRIIQNPTTIDTSSQPPFDRLVHDAVAFLPSGLTIHDDRIEDASRLYARGASETSVRARLLCRPRDTSFNDPRVPCKSRRWCRSCADRYARQYAHEFAADVARFVSPIAVLVRLLSAGPFDAAETLRALTRGHRTMRRRKWFMDACVGGVMALEAPLARNGRSWNIHMHAVYDLRLEGDEREHWVERCAREWRELLGPRAFWGSEDLASRAAFARYVFKVASEKSTFAGDLPPRLGAQLERALRHKRLIRRWGNASIKETP